MINENLDSEEDSHVLEQRQFKVGKMQEGISILLFFIASIRLFQFLKRFLCLRFARVMTAVHDAATSYRFVREEEKKAVVQTRTCTDFWHHRQTNEKIIFLVLLVFPSYMI